MNRVSIGRYLKKKTFRYGVTGLTVCLLGVGVGVMAISNSSTDIAREPSQDVQTVKVAQEKLSKNEPTPSTTSPAETNQETSKVVTSGDATVTTPQPSIPSTQPSSPPSAPTVQEFGVTYLSLSSPAVYCSGGGDYYIAQIGDINVGLLSNTGGQITYGYEVMGGIPDNWNGYHQLGTVPAGAFSTSINKIYWGDTTDPHMAYSEVIYSGHGVAGVRAVIYTPTLMYSPWMTIPAQQFGEKCS